MKHLLKMLGVALVLVACGPHPVAQKSGQAVQPPSPQIEVKEYWEH